MVDVPDDASEQIMRQNLLVIAQTYASAGGWSLSTVSKQIHGNQAFLADYLAGKVSTSIKTYYRMLGRLRAGLPKGTEWPETRAVPAPKRLTYQEPVNLPDRGPGGRFLGKKVHRKRERG